MRRTWTAALVAVAVGGCGHDFEPPDQGERVREATLAYSAELFDTVTWVSDGARGLAGNEVYAARCRRCHGTLGRGDTEYARERGLDVPSLVEREWALASMDSLRRKVFVGHEDGMPIFGVAGIELRDIDSSSYYVLHVLRPDVLAGGGSRP